MNLYQILGVLPSASSSEIHAAYKMLAKSLHPDVNPHGAELFRAVAEAYAVLSDRMRRSEYDRSLKVRPISTAPAAVPGTFDLTAIAKRFLPANVYSAAGPSFERAMRDRGIAPDAVRLETVLESFGLLKKKRRIRKSA